MKKIILLVLTILLQGCSYNSEIIYEKNKECGLLKNKMETDMKEQWRHRDGFFIGKVFYSGLKESCVFTIDTKDNDNNDLTVMIIDYYKNEKLFDMRGNDYQGCFKKNGKLVLLDSREYLDNFVTSYKNQEVEECFKKEGWSCKKGIFPTENNTECKKLIINKVNVGINKLMGK